jgi:endonuclease/exonuclease/phosphatase family metal-dependent hydrolase
MSESVSAIGGSPRPAPRSARHTARGAVCGALLTGAVMIFASGVDRTPADPSAPLVIGYSPQTNDHFHWPLRVSTFNIHGGKGLDGRIDLNRTAALLSDADLVGLNEVRLSGGVNQSSELGRILQRTAVFAPTERQWWRDHFGNGLLTRGPAAALQRIPFEGTRGKAFRNAILAVIEVHDEDGRVTPVRVLSTHLDSGADRQRHLARVFALFDSLAAPKLLIGDLNSAADDPALAERIADGRADGRYRCPLDVDGANRPTGAIDWIFFAGLKCDGCEYVANSASDHLLLKATFLPE